MNDEINANEELIRFIRSKDDSADMTNLNSEALPMVQTASPSGGFWKLRRKHVLGIDIGFDALKIVKMTNGADPRRSLVAFSIAPYAPELFRRTREFGRFLKNQIKRFASGKGIDIWCTVHVEGLDIRHFRIPKVSRKQLPNTIYWTYHKKNPFNEEERIFDFQILKGMAEGADDRLEIIAYTVPKAEIERIKALFSRIGLNLTGLTSYPFAYQNILGIHRNSADERLNCSVYFGRQSSRIDIFLPDGSVVYSRSIKVSMRSMAQAIADAIGEMSSSGLPEDEFRTLQAVDSPRLREGWALLDDLIRKDTSLEREVERSGVDLTREDVKKIIGPVVRRLAWQIERTIDHVATGFDGKTAGTLFVSGGLMDSDEMVPCLESELDSFSEIRRIDPFDMGVHLQEGLAPSEDPAERSAFTPAIGAALSDKFSTPNFLFTFREKAAYYRSRRLVRSSWLMLGALAVSMIGGFAWQKNLIYRNGKEIARIEQRLKEQVLRDRIFVNEPLIEGKLRELNQKKAFAKAMARRASGMVIIEDIASALPESIRMMKIRIDLRGTGHGNHREGPGRIEMEGVVKGDAASLETTLITYLERLMQKPVFGPFTIERKAEDMSAGQKTLRFAVVMPLTV